MRWDHAFFSGRSRKQEGWITETGGLDESMLPVRETDGGSMKVWDHKDQEMTTRLSCCRIHHATKVDNRLHFGTVAYFACGYS
jgi:hypothetical protein